MFGSIISRADFCWSEISTAKALRAPRELFTAKDAVGARSLAEEFFHHLSASLMAGSAHGARRGPDFVQHPRGWILDAIGLIGLVTGWACKAEQEGSIRFKVKANHPLRL